MGLEAVKVARGATSPARSSARVSDAHLAHFAANCFDDLKLVCVNHLDLGLVTHKSRDANVRQRRSEFHVVGPKLPGGAPFLKGVPGIERGTNRRVIRLKACFPAKAVEHEAPVIQKTRFASDQVAVHSVE